MINIELLEIAGLEPAIHGMRNAYNSWDKSDSRYCAYVITRCSECTYRNVCDDNLDKNMETRYILGPNDHELASKLAKAGSDHRKYMRMIDVWIDITAPLYWWKEFSTYKIGTVANSCSTMHTIADKEFTIDDFSHEHLNKETLIKLEEVINYLNISRDCFISDSTRKDYWWQMVQLLPTSYNQKRTIKLNYEVLTNMYHARKNHRLDEWREFCKWIETLPYSELITETKKKGGE